MVRCVQMGRAHQSPSENWSVRRAGLFQQNWSEADLADPSGNSPLYPVVSTGRRNTGANLCQNIRLIAFDDPSRNQLFHNTIFSARPQTTTMTCCSCAGSPDQVAPPQPILLALPRSISAGMRSPKQELPSSWAGAGQHRWLRRWRAAAFKARLFESKRSLNAALLPSEKRRS